MTTSYLDKVKSRVGLLINYLQVNTENSESQKQFIKKLNRYKINWNSGTKNIVLTQGVEDHIMSIKLAATSHYLAKKNNANIAIYTVETKIEDPRYRGENFIRKKLTEKLYRTSDNIFLSFGGKIIHRNIYSYPDKTKVEKHLAEIKNKIKSKNDILKIEIENLPIGDLIYDTYLRFANKPTVDINDEFLNRVILESLNMYFNFKDLLEKYPITALVNSYTTYTKHGIIARMCLSRNIPVYTPLCGYISLVHEVSKDYPSHRNNHFNYRVLFNALPNKKEIIKTYTALFEKRFQGIIDGATSYMKESAFSSSVNDELKDINWANTIIVLAHCFFDSPHIYRDLLFPDFYEWMVFTLDNLKQQSNLNILVKQHPNGMAGNDEIFEELKIKYKNSNIKFIDKKTSQLQIIHSKPKAIITAYGTAGAEFSYYGIPVLTIYDNPFTAYNFTHIATTITEYKYLIDNITELSSKQNKEEIIEYYYMHNYFFLAGRDADYLSAIKYKDDNYSDNFLNEYLPQMGDAYFARLDSSISDGFSLTEWEELQVKNPKLQKITV